MQKLLLLLFILANASLNGTEVTSSMTFAQHSMTKCLSTNCMERKRGGHIWSSTNAAHTMVALQQATQRANYDLLLISSRC